MRPYKSSSGRWQDVDLFGPTTYDSACHVDFAFGLDTVFRQRENVVCYVEASRRRPLPVVREKGVDVTWLFDAVRRGQQEAPSPEDLADVIQGIDTLVVSDEIEELQRALRAINVSRLHPALLVTIVRTVFPFRNKLTDWATFLNRVKTSLDKRGYNSLMTLKGLSG